MYGSSIGTSFNEPYRSPYAGANANPRLSQTTAWPPSGGSDAVGTTPFWNIAGSSMFVGGANPGGLNAIFGAFGNFVQALFAQISQYVGQLSGGASGGASAGAPQRPERWFSNAEADSEGDPHDSLSGTAGDGSQVKQTWDDQHAHRDLLTSGSFAGGYRVATQVTAPGANGVTLNASATVVTDHGATAVTYNAGGSVAIRSSGQAVQLTVGTPADLGSGERATLNADGSLLVEMDNGRGGRIATTLSRNGSGGVDVRNSAQNVNLGGYLVEHPGQ